MLFETETFNQFFDEIRFFRYYEKLCSTIVDSDFDFTIKRSSRMNDPTSSSKRFCDLLSTIINGKKSVPTPLPVIYSQITKNEDKFFPIYFGFLL